MEYQLCALSDFGTDDIRAFDVDGEEVVVFRLEDGNFSALHDRCSHAEIRLSEGTLEDGCVECPAHGARFDVYTGQPKCLPAVKPVKAYTITVKGGLLYIEI